MGYEYFSEYDAWKLKGPGEDQKTRTVVLKKVVERTCEVEVPVDGEGEFAVDDVWELWDDELVEEEEVGRDYE